MGDVSSKLRRRRVRGGRLVDEEQEIQPHSFGSAQGLDSTKAWFSPRDAEEQGLDPQIFLLKNNSGTAHGARKDIII